MGKREQLLEIMEDAAKGETKATLRARIAELEAENERLTKERDAQLAETQRAWNERDGEKRLRLKAKSLSRTGAVKVKALEWEDREERRLGATTEKFWRAQTAFDWGYRVKSYGKGFSFGDAESYPTVDAAKAAAQADYERRILSTLEPAVPEGQQPVACVACEDKPTHPNDPCAVCGKSTRPSEQAVTEAGKGLLRIVEEIDGAMKHGTWRDERGMRFKDTPEWVAFYNALKAAMEAGQ